MQQISRLAARDLTDSGLLLLFRREGTIRRLLSFKQNEYQPGYINQTVRNIMCGRYTLKEDSEDLEHWFEAEFRDIEDLEPNYNAAPSHNMPVVRQSGGGSRVIERFKWGFLPFWAKHKEVAYSMINARGETVDSKNSFKPYFKNQRCLVPASGFYEWKGEKGNKTPFYIFPTHEPFFAFAGLYSVWKSPQNEEVPTYTIITTRANKKMEPLHDRMPVILVKEEWDHWLDPDFQDTQALKDLLNPFPDDAIDYYQVSKEVNRVSNNSPNLLEQYRDLFG